MRRSILLALLLALALPAAANAATEQERICAERGDTVARSGTARVFEVDRNDEHTFYACLRRGGRLQELTSWFSCECSRGDDPSPGVALLAERFVVVTRYPSCGPFPCDLPTRYTLRNLRSQRDYAPRDAVSQVVTGDGFFAYEDGRVVMVRGGAEQVVDPGPGIERASLATAGRRLYWLRDGAPQFTVL